MSQIKIYGLKRALDGNREKLSDAIHQSVIDALSYPADKKFHRFIALDEQDFIYPKDRSSAYTIIEISMFQGRTIEAKKALVKALFSNIQRTCGISPQDIEITIFETPKENWGIRGSCGDELALNYKVNV